MTKTKSFFESIQSRFRPKNNSEGDEGPDQWAKAKEFYFFGVVAPPSRYTTCFTVAICDPLIFREKDKKKIDIFHDVFC